MPTAEVASKAAQAAQQEAIERAIRESQQGTATRPSGWSLLQKNSGSGTGNTKQQGS